MLRSSVQLEQYLTLMKKQGSNYIELKAVTWEKDSHGLFDYECKSLKHDNHFIQKSCTLTLNIKDSSVSVADKQAVQNLASNPSLQTHLSLGAMEIDALNNTFIYKKKAPLPNGGEIKSNQPYIVIRSLKNDDREQRGYELQLGDIIKFGRLEYIVREYRDHNQTKAHGTMRIDFEQHEARVDNPEGTCKVCLGDEQTQDNFLLSPCKCKGSCELIHLLCLKQWIQSKILKETQGIVDSYNFTKFQCEICKVPFPEKVVKNNVEYPMLIIAKPNHPYIILENISQKKDHRNMHLISFKGAATQPLKVGRGHQCQIRLSDISVSRVHAQLKFEKNKFIIFDNISKFGTLIKVQENIPITESKVAIQIGRTVMICCLKTRQSKKTTEETFRKTK